MCIRDRFKHLGLLGRIAHRVVIAQRQNPCLHRACVQNGLRPGRGGAYKFAKCAIMFKHLGL